MKTKILLLCFSITVIPFLDGCKKYPDGPTISLSSKKGRVANTWKYEKVFEVATGIESTQWYNGDYIEFKKDGTYSETYGSSTYVGTWAFSSNKEEFIMTSNGSSNAQTYQIRKLKGKEFWFREPASFSNPEEFHLSPK